MGFWRQFALLTKYPSPRPCCLLLSICAAEVRPKVGTAILHSICVKDNEKEMGRNESRTTSLSSITYCLGTLPSELLVSVRD